MLTDEISQCQDIRHIESCFCVCWEILHYGDQQKLPSLGNSSVIHTHSNPGRRGSWIVKMLDVLSTVVCCLVNIWLLFYVKVEEVHQQMIRLISHESHSGKCLSPCYGALLGVHWEDWSVRVHYSPIANRHFHIHLYSVLSYKGVGGQKDPCNL